MTTRSHPPLSVNPQGSRASRDGAFDFGPPGGAGPVRPPPVAEEMLGQSHVDMVMPKLTRKRLMRMIQMPEVKLMCTKGHQ